MSRFAYEKDLIPLLNQLAEQIGREKFVAMFEGGVRRGGAQEDGGTPANSPRRVGHALLIG
jgi:hypothetical protein